MRKRFETLDSFRGLAALFIIVFHIRAVGSITEWDLFRQTHIVVELFFVLSGFVLAHSYGFRPNFDFFSAIKSRFFRIYPLHLAMLAVMVFLTFLKFLGERTIGFSFGDPAFTGSSSPTELLANLFLLHAWFPFFDSMSFNFTSWSISIEFYMYFLFFCTVVAAKQYKRFIWVLIAAGLAGFMLFYLGDKYNYIDPYRGLLGFFSGCCSYLVYQRFAHWHLNVWLATVLELALVVLILFCLAYKFSYRYFAFIAMYMVFILLFAYEHGHVSQFLRRSFFQWLGKISYSIYLTHIPFLIVFYFIVMFAQIALGKTWIISQGGLSFFELGAVWKNNLLVLALFVPVLAISHWTYHRIEEPGQRLGKRLSKK